MNYWIGVSFVEAILTYINARIGSRRFRRSYESRLPSTKYDRRPPKLLQKHFDLSGQSVHVFLYLNYLTTYILYIRIFILLIAVWFSPTVYGIVYLSTFCLTILLTIFEMIIFFPANWKLWREERRLKKEQFRKKKSLKDDIQDDIVQFRFFLELMQNDRDNKWEQPLIKQLERCVHKKKGKEYLRQDDVKYVETKILPRYRKYVNYIITVTEQGEHFLELYSQRNQRMVVRMLIKNE